MERRAGAFRVEASISFSLLSAHAPRVKRERAWRNKRADYWRRSRPGCGITKPGVARHGLMSSPPRRV